jgi:hypothetical protein
MVQYRAPNWRDRGILSADAAWNTIYTGTQYAGWAMLTAIEANRPNSTYHDSLDDPKAALIVRDMVTTPLVASNIWCRSSVF